MKSLEVIGCLSVFLTTFAYADQSILDRYYDSTLPSFSVTEQPTDIRYTDENYVPTNFTSTDDVQRLMDQLKINEKSKAECYQRAHLWSIEMLQMAKVKSGKVFL